MTWRIFVLLVLYFANQPAQADTLPPLFFYPLPHHFANGQRLESPQTMTAEQITAEMPPIPQASGVVLLVYWSTLCPEEGHCDFGLIDRTLRYWQTQHKQVVLDVAIDGYPISTPSGLQTATPAWVLANVHTYIWQTKLLGEGPQEVPAVMPDFTDKRFLAEVAALVHQLQRYDGNPAISQIRIATGLMGEDNPLIGPVMASAAGFSERDWLDFTRRVAPLYFAAFHRTELEFDIGRLSWMAARGSPVDRYDVDQFIGELLKHRVLLAFDGLGSECLRQIELSDPRNGIGQSLRYLREYKSHSGRIGLEAIGHASAPQMRDVQAVVDVVRTIKPDRLVLFSETTGGQRPLDQLLTALGYR
jgi:hypothetical protein